MTVSQLIALPGFPGRRLIKVTGRSLDATTSDDLTISLMSGANLRVVSARRDDQRHGQVRASPAPHPNGRRGLGQVRPGARLRQRQSISAALGGSVEPGQAAAGKHRIDASWGRGEARDPDVISRRPDFDDRRHRDAQIEMKLLTRERRHRLKRFGGGGRVGRRYGEARAVAAKDERKRPSVQRVGDGRDRTRADHVDRLVSAIGDGFGRPDDVSEADHPVVRQRTIVLAPHRVGKVVEHWNGLIEVVGHVRPTCAREALTNPNTDRMPQSFERNSVWISGPAPPPNVTSWPRSIDWLTKAFAAATASGNGAPRTMLAAMALDSVQPVPCRFSKPVLAPRNDERLLCHQKVDRFLAYKMSALHQHRSRTELGQRLALAHHLCFGSRDRLPNSSRRFSEIWG